MRIHRSRYRAAKFFIATILPFVDFLEFPWGLPSSSSLSCPRPICIFRNDRVNIILLVISKCHSPFSLLKKIQLSILSRTYVGVKNNVPGPFELLADRVVRLTSPVTVTLPRSVFAKYLFRVMCSTKPKSDPLGGRDFGCWNEFRLSLWWQDFCR